MYRLSVDNRSADQDLARSMGRSRTTRYGIDPMMSYLSKHITLDATICASVASHSRARIFGHRIQHRLNIRRRAGDDTQDFTRRSLLLQRFLQFLKQPHVLDGDHRLVGKGFEEPDLRGSERTHLGATRIQRSDEFSLLTKRNSQEGAKARRRDQTLGNRLSARTSGTWSVPCSRIQRYRGASILISSVGRSVWDQNGPAQP